MTLSRSIGNLRNLPALPAGLLLSGTLLVFVPAVIYQGNQPFFPVSLAAMFAYLVPIWLGLALLLALPSAGPSTRGKRLYTRLLTAVAVAIWANATFAIGTTGMLDGTNFELVRGFTALYQNTGWVALVSVVVFFAAGRFAKPVRAFVLLFVALLSINAAYIAATVRMPGKAAADTRRFKSFSKSSNLLYVLMDTFQSDLFAELLERDSDLAKGLDGFTYFPDTAAASPTTYVAMPSIHSGQVWDTTTPLPAFYQRTIAQGSFLNTLVDAGFEGMLVQPIFQVCPQRVVCNSLADVALGGSNSAWQASTELVDIALLRAAPHLLKPMVFRDGEWLLSGISLLRGSDTHLSNVLLDNLAADLQLNAPKPTVKFLHLFNTHPPANFTANCQYTGRVYWTRESAEGLDRCALTHVFGLLEGMKRAGVYDNTAIVLFADHGSYLPRNGTAALAVRANPLLLIKPAQAKGPLRVSTVQASLTDLPATACALTKACQWPVGSDVFALHPGAARERRFVDYTWQAEYWKMGIFPINGRYRLNGPVLNTDSWDVMAGVQNAPVHKLAFTSGDPTHAFGPGWAEVGEKAPRWTAASSAVLFIDAPPGGSGKVTATVSTHGGNKDQRMEVFVAGQRVYQGAVALGSPHEVTFQVPRAALAAGRIALRFRFSQWTTARIHKKETPAAVAFHHLETQ